MAYLDVFPEEPANLAEFDGVDNIQTTSHIAGVSSQLTEDVLSFEKQVLKDWLNQKEFSKIYKELDLRQRKQDGFFI